MSSVHFFDEVHARYGDPAAFIKTMRSKMALHGVTQSKLAERAGFQAIRVSEWVNGRVNPSLASMLVLDEALEHIIRGD